MEAYKFNKHIKIEAISIEMSVAEAKAVLKFLESTIAYGSEDRETKEMLLKTLESGLEKRNEAEPEPNPVPAYKDSEVGVVNYDENGIPF